MKSQVLVDENIMLKQRLDSHLIGVNHRAE